MLPGQASAAGLQQPAEAAEVGVGSPGGRARLEAVRPGTRAHVAGGTELVPDQVGAELLEQPLVVPTGEGEGAGGGGY